MGFEIERFIGDVDEEYVCPICSGVLEDPLQAPDCEHAFCRACITEWISRQPNCPVDRQPVTASQLRPAPRFMRNVLSRLCTSCDYAPHGCNAVLKLASLACHLVECEFNPERPVPCEAGCGLVIPKGELADHNCFRKLRALILTHQEKLNVCEQELADNKIAHQGKLHNYEQELAELKRAHQEKLNNYKRELAELKRELAVLKEFKQEMRLLNPNTRAAVRALADQRDQEDVVRWSNTLALARVTRWYTLYHAPGNDLKMRTMISLSESGCPPHIINDLMKNCEIERWPPLIRSSYKGGTLTYRFATTKYVCKRVPGQEAVVILDCDNTHVDQQQMMVKPGFIVIFQSDSL